jgi:peptidoglycan hydrolase-like protein with peptidoglycan-binding domain
MDQKDQMVLLTQQWLNGVYKDNINYSVIIDDGVTGWATITALTKALQIELGISTPNGNFGPATSAAFGSLSINSQPQDNWSNADIISLQNKIFILQGALYCKGYDGGFTGKFTTQTDAAVKKLQTDAGLSSINGVVNSVLMKSLLSMDSFVLLNYGSYLGKEVIRKIQQYLNKKYISNQYFSTDIGLVPCDGIYGRSTNKALLYALQIEEGIAVPNGVFGPSTKSLCPTIPLQTTESRFVYLLQAALYCNGEDPNGFDGGFGNGCRNSVIKFQTFAGLSADGIAGMQTWASLLVSTGDPLRKGKACDTNDTITQARALTLKNDGRYYIGRYLTGKYKITPEELNIIYSNGLKLIPIMQVLNDERSYFSSTTGLRDAQNAITISKSNGFANNTVIYFAIDYDAITTDMTDYIEPYFSAVKKVFSDSSINPNNYRIGVYAPRAICTLLADKGYTCSSYVSDMSTGFTSNLGTRLPENWSYDQIYEYPGGIGSGSGQLVIDNVIARDGHLEYCTSINQTPQYSFPNVMSKINANPLLQVLGVEMSFVGTLVFVNQENLKVSLDVGTKYKIGDDAYTTIQIKNGKIDGSDFQNTLTNIIASLSTEEEVGLSKSIEISEDLDLTLKISTNAKYIKIEIESPIDLGDVSYPYPLTATFCIEIGFDNNQSIDSQGEFILQRLNALYYNVPTGQVPIGKKVLDFIGSILLYVVLGICAAALVIVIFSSGILEGAAGIILLLINLFRQIAPTIG